MAHYDAIVVVAGVVGSAATAHLACDEYDVLALERYGVPNSLSTAHGGSRIFQARLPRGEPVRPDAAPGALDRALKTWSSSLM